MTDEKKAQWIRRLVMVTVFGSAITFGYFVKVPVWPFGKDNGGNVMLNEEAIRKELAAENRLTVLNSMVDGSPDSEELSKILEDLKTNKYGDQVEAVDLDVELRKTLAAENAVDPEKFAGQLDFYTGGHKLGTLKDQTDPVVVEKTIDRYLAALVQHYGPNWLTKVDGTRRVPANAPAPSPAVVMVPNLAPSGVPGMERTSGGVPGMTPVKPGQSSIKVKPTDVPKQ